MTYYLDDLCKECLIKIYSSKVKQYKEFMENTDSLTPDEYWKRLYEEASRKLRLLEEKE